MKKFVLSFLFNPDKSRVVLIKKNRPDWMAGKLNAIGGHVEPGEDPREAAHREFLEETGIHVPTPLWQLFLTLDRGGDRMLYCFWFVSHRAYQSRSLTDEPVNLAVINELNPDAIVKDTLWILALALEAARQVDETGVAPRYEMLDKSPEKQWLKLD